MIFELTSKGDEGPRQKEVQNIGFQELKQQVKRPWDKKTFLMCFKNINQNRVAFSSFPGKEVGIILGNWKAWFFREWCLKKTDHLA